LSVPGISSFQYVNFVNEYNGTCVVQLIGATAGETAAVSTGSIAITDSSTGLTSDPGSISADVEDAPLTATWSNTAYFIAGVSQNVVIGLFSDGYAGAPLSDYYAPSVNDGAGGMSTGAITDLGNNSRQVSDDLEYANPGTYSIAATVTDVD